MYGESGIEVRMLHSWAPKLFKTFIFALKKGYSGRIYHFISNKTILLKNSTLFYLTLRYDGRYMLQFSILGLNFSELGG